jgi:hypothetical protein
MEYTFVECWATGHLCYAIEWTIMPTLDCFWLLCVQVRKEKLGDRITALQQLVSPFGKVSFPSSRSLLISFCVLCIIAYGAVHFLSFLFIVLQLSMPVSWWVLICTFPASNRWFLDWYGIGSSRGHRIHQVPSRSSRRKCPNSIRNP